MPSRNASHRGPARLGVVAAVAVALAVVAGVGVVGAAVPPLNGGPASAGPSAHRVVKPVLSGLILMPNQEAYLHGLPFPTVDPGVLGSDGQAFAGTAVDVGWSQLEPTDGRYDWAPLDASLAAVKAYNGDHPSSPLGVKLRVVGGYDAPSWATGLGGGPITIGDRAHGAAPGTLGRWWTAPYRAAWSTFEHALARRYDANPLIRMVQVTSCATTTQEPFIAPGRPVDRATLRTDGWTTADEESCLSGAFADYSGWHHTTIDYPVNTFRTELNGRGTADTKFPTQIATECATSSTHGGPACVIDNHGLRDSSATSPGSSWLFALVDQLWREHPTTTQVAFQAYSPNTGDCAAVAVAVTHHARSVELWAPSPLGSGFQGFRSVPTATLVGWDRALRSGRPPVC
jgi:hypothetical protein